MLPRDTDDDGDIIININITIMWHIIIIIIIIIGAGCMRTKQRRFEVLRNYIRLEGQAVGWMEGSVGESFPL